MKRILIDFVRLIILILILTMILSLSDSNWIVYLSLSVLVFEIIVIHQIYSSADDYLKNIQYRALKYVVQILITSIIGYSIVNLSQEELYISNLGLIKYCLFLLICYNGIFVALRMNNSEISFAKNRKFKIFYLMVSLAIIVLIATILLKSS